MRVTTAVPRSNPPRDVRQQCAEAVPDVGGDDDGACPRASEGLASHWEVHPRGRSETRLC